MEHLITGFQVVSDPGVLVYIFFGTVLGVVFGALPGVKRLGRISCGLSNKVGNSIMRDMVPEPHFSSWRIVCGRISGIVRQAQFAREKPE